MTDKSFTKILAIIPMVIISIMIFFINNRIWTEDRAYDNVNIFIDRNNLKSIRTSCSGDSDGDGYGSCTIVIDHGEGKRREKIYLKCPTDFVDVRIWGVTSCKEVPAIG